MKRFLLSIIAIFAMTLCSFAQSIVCTDNACTPITDQTFSNTSVPYYCPQSLTFEHGQAVDVCITIMCPETTNVTVYSFPATAQIQSLTITGLSNLPEGLSYCVSRVEMDPTTNVYATIHITGTAPSTNEDYDLELSGIFTGTASAMGYDYPLNNESVSFATGIVLSIGEGQSQPSEIVCDDPCPAVTNQPMSQTTIPYYAPEELNYNVNEAVDVCITIQCPANTNVEYMGMQAAATITSLTITGFANLPEGLSYCVSRVDMDPTTNNFATLHLTGTPTTAGEYNLNLSCNVTGTANVFGSDMPLNNQAITFPTGIVVTIEEETSEFIEAHFTANPEIHDNYGDMGFVSIYQGESITFTNASTNAHHIVWTFTGGDIETSTENVVTVTYAEVGSFSTTLTAYNADESESSTKTVTIGVTPQPQNVVVANFTTNPEATQLLGGSAIYITIGETITYTNTSENATSIAWTFEGGSPETSTDNTVEVTYATAGVYTTTLVAYGGNNTPSVKTVGVNVSEPQPQNEVVADFTTDPEATPLLSGPTIDIIVGQTITYTNTSENATNIEWTFEGGNPSSSTENVVEVIYTTGGIFLTTLVAYGENNEQSVKTVYVYVNDLTPPDANFTADPEIEDDYGDMGFISIIHGESITFTNTSNVNTHHIAWTFTGGDIESSTENIVTVTYAEAGTFTATLTAYNESESESDIKTVTIYVDAIIASFTTSIYTYQILGLTAGETVVYNSTCSTSTDHIVWTFEGGTPNTSTDNVVNVTYNTVGNFTTTLVAYNADETITDTATLLVFVSDEVSVDETAISEINVYPNPTSSVINIAAEGMQNITIMDMTGRVIMSKDVNSNFESISAEGFARANYMVRIATADGVVVKNIVVE